jgi:hypothetical protein
MSSAASVLILLYYFFAIIGMELFAGFDMKNCCMYGLHQGSFEKLQMTNIYFSNAETQPSKHTTVTRNREVLVFTTLTPFPTC